MSEKLKIAVVGSVGVPANYGGWETLVAHLCKQISEKCDLTVYCSAGRYPERLTTYEGAKLEYVNLDANGVSSIPYDLVSMVRASSRSDVQIVLGVSGTLFLPVIKLFSPSKFIVNIDGLEWRRAKWNGFAKWYLKLSERVAVRFADAIITDNAVLQRYVQSTYGRSSQLIAYGGDHVQKLSLRNETLNKYPFLNAAYAFKVARIEPENNIELILKAFENSENLPLVLVGNWGVSDYGTQLKRQYESKRGLYLLDAVYDQLLLDELRSNSKVYIHGHSAGGTNPSLVEAMSLGLPVFAFDVDFNRETTGGAAFYFTSDDELKSLLASCTTSELAECGELLHRLAGERYSWSGMASQYLELARSMCDHRSKSV